MKKISFERKARFTEANQYPGSFWKNGILHHKNGQPIAGAKTGKQIRQEAKEKKEGLRKFKPKKKQEGQSKRHSSDQQSRRKQSPTLQYCNYD
ncbi:MAG: hypothetical protein WC244_04385 [Patescibacteria group bacterium]|jgi:hypothetical protein